jgi:TonB-linked SusC/RagA family outer membrane protein
MSEMMKTPVTNFDQALTGKVAGVVVTTSDGSLGAEANITIRGNNSLTQSSAPLYVIDGFPTESSMATAIASADIESIDILKDASATAIYGARGANGVIVITTKQGNEGKPKINFSASWTGSNIAKKVDLMDAYEFVKLQTEMNDYWKTSNLYLRNAEGEVVYTPEDYLASSVESYDWQDQIYRNALTQNYNLSISGGHKEAGNRYNISFSATDQDGIIVKSNFQRYQGKLNFQQKIGDKVTFDFLANYSRSTTNGVNPTSAQQSSSASGWLMYSVWGYRPVTPLSQQGGDDSIVDSILDSSVSSGDDYRFNPAKTVRNEYRKTIVDYLNANAGLTWEIIPDLKLKVTGGYTINKRRREEFNGTQTYTGYVGSPSGKGINGGIYWNDKTTWLNENTLTYTKRFLRKHNFQFLGGFTMQGETFDYKGTVAEQMSTEALGINGLHTGNYQNVTPWQYDWSMMSALFRMNYNFKYKYYLTFSFRADGSSKFPVGNRWGYFPSAGLSWNFNREDWLKDKTWLSNGKLRASWGQTGNNRTTTPYDYYSQIATLPGHVESYDYVFNGQIVSGYFPSNMSNEKLRWETTDQWNVGLDVSFFENRIKMTADWYLKNTRDLLLQATIPASSGYTSAMLNIGSMQNQGVEFTLNLVPIQRKNFSWAMDFNIAMNRNKVTALTNNQYSLMSEVKWDYNYNSQYPYITQVGKPSGMMYGYIYEGTYKSDEFNGNTLKDGVPYMNSIGKDKTKPGDPKYRDVNKDGIIDDNDRTIIGCGQPIHTGGFGNTFNFYGFDVNVFFAWSYGNDVINANRLVFENGSKQNLNLFSSYSDHWTEVTNENSDIPRIGANGMNVYSSRVVEDASFLRLKNITIGYTFPRSVLRKMHFDTMRVYLSAENVFTLTGYTGPDPEVSTRNSVLTPGFDWSAYPRSKGVTAGLSFTF